MGIGGGLGFDGPPLGLGTEDGGAAVDDALLTAEQQLVEWAPPFSAKLTAEQQLADWAPAATALLTAEQQLVEWAPVPHARILDVQQLVEFTTPSKAMLAFIRPLVEWAVPERAFLFAESPIVEWVPGNVMTADRGKLVIGWSQGGMGNGDMYHRALADFALAELEQGGERDQDPNGGPGSGDGFPINGEPPPELPDDGAGLARYKNDVDDTTDWGPPLV